MILNNIMFCEAKTKDELINDLKKMKPTELVGLLASDDNDIVETLEAGTPAYENWIDLLDGLNVNEVLSSNQVKQNIKKLKNYVKNSSQKELFGSSEEELNDVEKPVTILDNKQVQELLCEVTRSFVRNIKQEFGNILLGFSARLIGLMSTLGRRNPARGAFYLVSDNSKLICSAIINQVSEFNESSPSVVGIEIERSSKDSRSLGLKYSISTTLINNLIKIFDEEVITNPEEAIVLNSSNKEVVDVASAIKLSDLVNVAKCRSTPQDGGYTIYDCFRMQRGGYPTNFNFGMQIVPLSPSSFDVLYYVYLADKVMKPNGIFSCDNWV